MILKNNPRAKDLRDVLITVVLFVLSYAPSPFGFLIYLAFIPQLHLYTRHKWPMAFLYGYLIGLLVNLITLYWIFFYADYGFAIIVTGNALQFAFFGGMLSFLHGKNEKLAWFAFPFLWTFLEYARQLGDLAFNWLNIAYTQSYYLYLLQYVEYTGYLGVVFWICLVNITLYYVIKTRYRVSAMVRGTLIIMILFLLPLAVGILKLNETPSAQGISVAYVQPNIDPVVKWERDFLHENLSMLLRLTDSVMVTQPDLVVWPETAVPYDLRSANDNLNLITDHVQRYRYHLLSGAMDQDAAGRYNAAYFFSPADTQFTVYRKLLLVPGAESLAYFPDWMGIDQSGYLKAGKDPVGFTYSGLLYGLYFNGEDWQVSNSPVIQEPKTVSSVICYESAFPNLVRRFYMAGSDLVVIITNDGWFGYSSQPYQHARVAVFRAIENRSSIIRCANTGISEFIDPYGRVYGEGGVRETRLAQKIMPLRLFETFYTRYGDLLGIISGILVFSSLILALLTQKAKPAG